MKAKLYILLLVCVNTLFAQNINVILQVNGKTLNGEVANLYMQIGEKPDNEKFQLSYYPGDLIVPEVVWSKIQTDTVNKFSLHFDYYTYKRGKQEVANFDVALTRNQLKQKYLIIDVYDFRDRKYKRRYQYITKKNYLVQLIYPQCGYYVPMR